MSKQKTYIIIISVVLIIMLILGYFLFINTTKDSLKFKKEYESLNDKYYKISINKDNTIKYSSYKEVFDVINSKTGIIFFGYPEDDDSRFAIEVLTKVIKSKGFDITIYYLNIFNDRDSYTIENDEVVYEKDKNGNDIIGTEEYHELVNILDEYLYEYILYLGDEKEYNTNTKYIHLPSIVFVKDGKVFTLEYADVDMGEEDLSLIFESDIENLLSGTCSINKEEAC